MKTKNLKLNSNALSKLAGYFLVGTLIATSLSGCKNNLDESILKKAKDECVLDSHWSIKPEIINDYLIEDYISEDYSYSFDNELEELNNNIIIIQQPTQLNESSITDNQIETSEISESFNVNDISAVLCNNNYYLFQYSYSQEKNSNIVKVYTSIFDSNIPFLDILSASGKKIHCLPLGNTVYLTFYCSHGDTFSIIEQGNDTYLNLSELVSINKLSDFGYDEDMDITFEELKDIQNELNNNQVPTLSN